MVEKFQPLSIINPSGFQTGPERKKHVICCSNLEVCECRLRRESSVNQERGIPKTIRISLIQMIRWDQSERFLQIIIDTIFIVFKESLTDGTTVGNLVTHSLQILGGYAGILILCGHGQIVGVANNKQGQTKEKGRKPYMEDSQGKHERRRSGGRIIKRENGSAVREKTKDGLHQMSSVFTKNKGRNNSKVACSVRCTFNVEESICNLINHML